MPCSGLASALLCLPSIEPQVTPRKPHPHHIHALADMYSPALQKNHTRRSIVNRQRTSPLPRAKAVCSALTSMAVSAQRSSRMARRARDLAALTTCKVAPSSADTSGLHSQRDWDEAIVTTNVPARIADLAEQQQVSQARRQLPVEHDQNQDESNQVAEEDNGRLDD